MRILRDLQNVIASEYYKTRHDVAAKLFLFFPVLLTVAFIVYDLWNLSQKAMTVRTCGYTISDVRYSCFTVCCIH